MRRAPEGHVGQVGRQITLAPLPLGARHRELSVALVRDNVRRSAASSLALEPTDAFVRVRIHSVDKDTPPSGQASAVAVIMRLQCSQR